MKDTASGTAFSTEAFDMPIAHQIWDMKYRHQDPGTNGPDGQPGLIHDHTVQDTWRRIARALSVKEKFPKKWEDRFYAALEDFRFLPAGRIISGAGTERNVTLFNCYVMGTIPDSMPGIFDMLKEAALTMQQGGGIGYDFSTIRPKGAPVIGVRSDASGPLSFMDVWDGMCRTIMSAGSRRGAMMATMRCDHPDIEDFITAKKDPARLRMFNLSVLVTDPFMEAVKADAGWDLVWNDQVWRTIRARDLWNAIIRSTYAQAEPGVIFIDRINALNPINYLETIASTNPCGEQPLPPYGACLLGSINMARLVSNPFSPSASIDAATVEELVATAVRMMDNVIDISNFPLEQQRAEAQAKRRIGLGVTGLADALMMLGLRYGSDEAVAMTRQIMKMIAHAAAHASIDLSIEKGAFPLFDADKYLDGPYIGRFDEMTQLRIRAHGVRNALLTSIAPTGTISLYAGNVSSGIEPVFAYAYNRKVLQPDGTRTTEEVVDYAVHLWRQKFGDKPFPDYFVNAQTLTPQDHVRMQAAAQEWVDSSISKTINCPEDISFEDFEDVYLQAYEMGCKGCTTYRPNDITGSVLTVSEPGKKADQPEAGTAVSPATGGTGVQTIQAGPGIAHGGSAPVANSTLDRGDILTGSTYRMKWPGDESNYYVTINDAIIDGKRVPLEIFVNTKNLESQAWISALTLMVSAIMRRERDVAFIAEQLMSVVDARGGQFMPGQGYVNSRVAAIGRVIAGHFVSLGIAVPEFQAFKGAPAADQPLVTAMPVLPTARQRDGCKDYGNCNMVNEAGCDRCLTCGFSACG